MGDRKPNGFDLIESLTALRCVDCVQPEVGVRGKAVLCPLLQANRASELEALAKIALMLGCYAASSTHLLSGSPWHHSRRNDDVWVSFDSLLLLILLSSSSVC
eukprot:759505-Hanusia_phi.AAC.1